MVMNLRYAIYEYILNNQEMIYSPDYELLLGNLLPIKYEKGNDQFHFNSYFENELIYQDIMQK